VGDDERSGGARRRPRTRLRPLHIAADKRQAGGDADERGDSGRYDERTLPQLQEEPAGVIPGDLHELGEPFRHALLVEREDRAEHLHVPAAKRDVRAPGAAHRPDEIEVRGERAVRDVALGGECPCGASGANDLGVEIDLERHVRARDLTELDLVQIGEERRKTVSDRAQAPLVAAEVAGGEAPARLAREGAQGLVTRAARVTQRTPEPRRPPVRIEHDAVPQLDCITAHASQLQGQRDQRLP